MPASSSIHYYYCYTLINTHPIQIYTALHACAHALHTQVYHSLKAVIKAKYGQDACNVGDEGGFAPNIASNREGAELLVEACKKSGHTDKVCVYIYICMQPLC
jgi:enolase